MAAFGEHPPIPASIENLLVDETVSTAFLKAECSTRVKCVHISSLSLKQLEDEIWTKPKLEQLSEELSLVIEQNETRSDCFIEIERTGCKIMQIGDLRITCAWPPFSDAWEITVVRPGAHLELSDYNLNDELINNSKILYSDKIIYNSINVKNNIVLRDKKEENIRKHLNFGHTIGHAIESIKLYSDNKVFHGEAVILGIKTAVKFSFKKKYLNKVTYNKIMMHIKKINFKLSVNKIFKKKDINKILGFMLNDKKNVSSKINLVLLKGIGSPIINKPFHSNEIKKFFLKELINL